MNWLKMKMIGCSSSSMESTITYTILFASLCTVISLEREQQGGQELSTSHLIPWSTHHHKFPRNYYQVVEDMEAWKRAPSANFYGMRGKKVPSSNFFGMRGKKGPSGFLGMRGKKLDSFRAPFNPLNNEYPPLEINNNGWLVPSAKSDGFLEDGKFSAEDLLFESQLLGEVAAPPPVYQTDTILEQEDLRPPRLQNPSLIHK